jgi:hypothetical protein
MKPFVLAPLAAALLLGACASMPIQNWPENQKPPGPNDARIIVSGSSPNDCFGRVFFVSVSRPGQTDVLTRVADANVSGGVLKSHFPDHYGRINVIALKPGRYIVYPSAAGLYQTTSAPTFNFEVAAGETAYIGELYVDAPCGATTGRVALFDRQERDVAVLVARNPAFKGVTVVKRIATPEP